ncbi:MAG: hypothetical protein JSR54_17620, partial [Proteobacteria bacterium]|nr:hypothetical protein [Pseudomonadota bacterium]
YVYSFKEIDALRHGGVQRIYTGNVATGEHQIDVAVSGKLASGRDYAQNGHFTFTKQVQPKLLGVTLGGPDPSGPAIRVGDW